MSGQSKTYDTLLADIKSQLNRIKSEIAPELAPELGAEVQRRLNRVLADVAETAYVPDADRYWLTQV